ncbi:MAG: hypothetical protein V7607_1707 [Solirubrobacteraceae bacterium]
MPVRLRQALTQLLLGRGVPRRTVRLRLTLLYGGAFLASGAALLAITYLLVVNNTSGFVFTSEDGASGSVVASPNRPSTDRQAPDVRRSPDQRTGPGGGASQPQPQSEQLGAQARRQHASVLHQLLIQSGIALGAMTLVSIALGWIVAGRVLRPLRTITAAARAISATNLHERLSLQGPNDELKELGDTFDGLLARLESSFESQRQFVANASHELRTPLARQRTVAQVALADPDATVESLRAAHERVLFSGAQQERLIEALLTLTRGQAGIDRREPFDLASITAQILAARRPEAERRGLDVHAALAPAAAAGAPRLVERVVANLVDNALRYNVAGGHVEVATEADAEHAVLSVINSGPMVPTAAVQRLMQPFQRLGPERTSNAPGVGLGLSIIQAIASAHDATLIVRPRARGGLHVAVRFPITTPGQDGQSSATRSRPSTAGGHAVAEASTGADETSSTATS